MAEYRQLVIVFLVTVLSFHSNLISAGILSENGNEWQLEEGNDEEMRIIDGTVANKNQFPYMVSIGVFTHSGKVDHFCGGSLISSIKILTAAHCVTTKEYSKIPMNAKILRVLLGVHNVNEHKHDAKLVGKIVKIKIHEEYNPRNWFNDIAILTLDSPVKFTNKISPICLPPQRTTNQYKGEMAIAKGWGHTKMRGSGSEILLHAVLKIISNSKCNTIYNDDEITDSMMCAYRRGKDTCQGDSGGPLVIETDDLEDNNLKKCPWIQVGIASWGIGCGIRRYPGVYTRVTSFLPWILRNK